MALRGSSNGDANEAVFLEQDALDSRRKAVETILRGSEAAVYLLLDQVNDPNLDPRDRRSAAVALLGYCGLGSIPAGTQGAPRAAGVSHLLDLIEARNEPADDTPQLEPKFAAKLARWKRFSEEYRESQSVPVHPDDRIY